MKLHTIAECEEHLKHMQPAHEGLVYGIAAHDLVERKMLSSRIIAAMNKKDSACEVVVVDLTQISAEKLKDEILTMDLFGAKKIFRMKYFEQAPKAILEVLEEIVSKQGQHPILLAESEKGDAKLWDRLGASLVLMDLTKEKPWDRKSRLLAWASAVAARHGKVLQQGFSEELYLKCRKDLSLMLQEVEKLALYAKDEQTLTLEHMRMLCGTEEECNYWTLAEAIVWEEKGIANAAAKELECDAIYPLLGQLRYHYQLALGLYKLVIAGESEHAISRYFPSLSPKNLQRYSKMVSRLKEPTLKNALNRIFECEVKMKSSSVSPKALWTDLLTHLSTGR